LAPSTAKIVWVLTKISVSVIAANTQKWEKYTYQQ